MILVSSTEHHAAFAGMGVATTKPEEFGADFLWAIPASASLNTANEAGWVGVQRKTVADFIASVMGERMGKELGQLPQCAVAMLIVEGHTDWTADGEMMGAWKDTVRWTRAQWNGALWSLQNLGVWLTWSADERETAEIVRLFYAWTRKPEHNSLIKRGGVVSPWGKPGSRDFARWVLMSFDGIGWELANRILDKFGGAPLQWTVTEQELMQVEGIGKVRSRKMLAALATLSG